MDKDNRIEQLERELMNAYATILGAAVLVDDKKAKEYLNACADKFRDIAQGEGQCPAN